VRRIYISKILLKLVVKNVKETVSGLAYVFHDEVSSRNYFPHCLTIFGNIDEGFLWRIVLIYNPSKLGGDM